MKYLVFFCLFSVTTLHAQTAFKATTFEWVGGQCCVRGQDYNISVKVDGKFEIVKGIMFVVNNIGYVHGQVHSFVNKRFDHFSSFYATK